MKRSKKHYTSSFSIKIDMWSRKLRRRKSKAKSYITIMFQLFNCRYDKHFTYILHLIEECEAESNAFTCAEKPILMLCAFLYGEVILTNVARTRCLPNNNIVHVNTTEALLYISAFRTNLSETMRKILGLNKQS